MNMKTVRGRHLLPTIILLSAGAAVQCAPTISVDLQFSQDNGKSYTRDFPVVGRNATVLVKASWQIEGENRPVKAGITTSILYNSERDFASAVTGCQQWGGKKAWYQRLKKYWFAFERERSCLYRLDLGERPEGQIGHMNTWDEKTNRHVNGPLPACPPLLLGTHRFTVRVGYHLEADNTAVQTNTDFLITVRDDGRRDAVAPAEDTKTVTPPVAPVAGKADTKPMPLPRLRGDYVLPVADCRVLAGEPVLERDGPFVVPSAKQEVAWQLPDITAGSYYLRVLVETGSLKNSEAGLGRAPFLYINGRAVEFLRCTPPVADAKRCYGIIETAAPVPLRPGDEIRWNTLRGYGGKRLGGIALAREQLTGTPLRIAYGGDPDFDDRLRLTGEFKATAATSDRLEYAFEFENVTPQAQTLSVSVRILDYFQRCVGDLDETVTAAVREKLGRNMTFARGDSDRYRAVVTVSDSRGPVRDIVSEILVDNLNGFRKKLWLNRDWEWTTLPEAVDVGMPADVPPGAEWRGVDLPASWQDAPNGPAHKHHVAWYRKRFTVPESIAGERCMLHFSRVSFTCKVFLNGKEIGAHWGPTGPFDIAATGLLEPGAENELLVGICDGVAARDYGEDGHTRDGRLLAPTCLKAGMGEVHLYTTGAPALGDVFVKTSFKTRRVTLDIALPDLPTDRDYTLTNTISFEGNPVLTFKPLEVPGGAAHRVTVERRWRKPILWGPTVFPLLQLTTELRRADGALLDRADARFGFREFSVEGRHLVWNGKRVKFSSRPFLSSWGWQLTRRNTRAEIREVARLSTRMGCRMHRHIYDPENGADIRDEEGIVFAQGRGGLAGPDSEKLNSEPFWDNTARFTREMIRGLRNHPSIVTWYLSNEFYGESHDKNSERLRQLGIDALKEDDTRLIEFGCDLDLRGFTRHISTHYAVDGNALRQPDAYFPEAAYWRRFDQSLEPGMKVPAGMTRRVANVLAESPITWGFKPIVVNESCWSLFFAPPDAMTKLAGDAVYADTRWVDLTHDAANTWFSRGHRDAEVGAITLWKWINSTPNWVSVPRADINILQRYHSFYAGTRVAYDVNLHFDEFRDAALVFEWELTGTDGRTVARDRDRIRFQACDLKRARITFKAPEVSERVRFTLTATLREGNTELRRVDFPISISPSPRLPLSSDLRIGVCDPAGNSAVALRRLISPIRVIQTPSAETLQQLDLLIIGEAVPAGALNNSADAIAAFAERGGRVLVLRQDSPPEFLPVSVQLTPRIAAINFIHRSAHPVVAGLDNESVSFWYPDHRVTGRCIAKPQSGNVRTIIEAGGPKGMLYGGLVEWSVGEGQVLCSQLNWLEALDEAPVALELWRATLAYLAAPVEVPGNAAYFGSEAGALRMALMRLGAGLDSSPDPARLADYRTAIVDAAVALPETTVNGLREFAAGGGTILLRNVTPATIGLARRLSGSTVNYCPPPAESWRGRAIRVGSSPTLAGVTNYDLFWKRRPESENFRPCYTSAEEAVAELGDWTVWGETAEALTYPAFVVRVPVGSGEVLIDLINWDKPVAGIQTHCDRIASALLTNLGVTLKGRTSVSLPTDLAYETVDISAYLNRPFDDEIDDDGKGGWTDQGRKLDLRDFPTDRPERTFAGVPFRIGTPNGCLVLASRYRDSKALPDRVDLPVGRKADVLFFLQSSAWTSATHHADYVIRYEDGTTATIKLVGGVNYRDWVASAPDEPFLYETDTVTRWAWSGESILFPKVSLYCMGWINPNPDKTVSTVSFESRKIGVPILVALTTARSTTPQEVTQRTTSSPEALKEAERLVQDGLRLLEDGATEQAAVTFRAAIRTAPDYCDAHLQLGYLSEKASKWDDAITIYEDLLKQVPDQLEAYSRIGACHEKLNRWEKAVETYRRSLAVNPNQPPVIQALAAAKKRVNR
jgi:hypothetical protein